MSNIIDEIRDYKDRPSQVTAIKRPTRFEVFLDGPLPEPGQAVEIAVSGEQPIIARVARHLGEHHVEVTTLSPRKEITKGASARAIFQETSFPAPTKQAGGEQLDLRHADYASGEASGESISMTPARLGLMDIAPERPVLYTGLEAIDLLSPLVAHGTNLLLDQGSATKALLPHMRKHIPDAKLMVVDTAASTEDPLATNADMRCIAPEGFEGAVLGLRAAACWANQWRQNHSGHLLFVARLPAIALEPSAMFVTDQSGKEVRYAELISWLGETLEPAREARITTILTLGIDASVAGMSEIIDTMGLGDVDAQLFFDKDNTYDPTRSTSRAELSPARATKAQETRAYIKGARQTEDSLEIFEWEDLYPEDQAIILDLDEWFITLG